MHGDRGPSSGGTEGYPMFLDCHQWLCLPPFQSFLDMFCCAFSFEHLQPSANLLKGFE